VLQINTEVQTSKNAANEKVINIIFTGTINLHIKDGNLDFSPMINVIKHYTKSLGKMELKFVYSPDDIVESQPRLTAAPLETQNLDELIRAISSATQLQYFRLCNLNLSEADANKVAGILINNPSLRHFELEKFPLPSRAADTLIAGLQKNKQLTLALPFCPIENNKNAQINEAYNSPERQQVNHQSLKPQAKPKASKEPARGPSTQTDSIDSNRLISPTSIQLPDNKGFRYTQYGTCVLFDPGKAKDEDKIDDYDKSQGVLSKVAGFLTRK
jgi:hypothetical protein